MGIFGFPMSGSDICGNYSTNLDMDLCETWIKIAGLTPFMRLSVNNLSSVNLILSSISFYILAYFILKNEFLNTRLFQVLNATLHLRYSLVPFFYTQMYHATMKGTLAIRPLIFE